MPGATGNGNNKAQKFSPLSLISDLYDDFEDKIDGSLNIPLTVQNSIPPSSETVPITTTPTEQNETTLNSLPPLKSKYLSDDEDDDYTHHFIRNSQLNKISNIQSNKSNNINNINSNNSNNNSPTNSGNNNNNNGVSFSIMKKKQVSYIFLDYYLYLISNFYFYSV